MVAGEACDPSRRERADRSHSQQEEVSACSALVAVGFHWTVLAFGQLRGLSGRAETDFRARATWACVLLSSTVNFQGAKKILLVMGEAVWIFELLFYLALKT